MGAKMTNLSAVFFVGFDCDVSGLKKLKEDFDVSSR